MEAIQEIQLKNTPTQTSCYHCGDDCGNSRIHMGEKHFCCNGCKLVYELLDENDLCKYYTLDDAPGVSPQEAGTATKYKYLEDETVRRRLINFTDGNTSTATFYIPSMHCASCVWLLENLYKLNPLVISSRVNFLKKELSVTYEETASTLRQVVELLSSIGYEPEINLNSLQKKISKAGDRELYIKLGVAGFAFANIMMLSFPEYLSQRDQVEVDLQVFFTYLNIFLAIPVFFYSSLDYFKSAWQGWKQRTVNMDVPISLGIITLFVRSTYEIVSGSGAGYMDSFTGLVFLLLLGKLFEKKTYDTLSFDRDYKSYFPVSVTIKKEGAESTVSLDQLEVGDRMIIRNQELIPADAILIRGRAFIDYSFVTGESNPVEKKSGDMIYAGGKQSGEMLELDVIKEVNQSYLTELWNDESFTKSHKTKITSMANSISKYFTLVVITIALASALYWLPQNMTLALNALTSVLIIACPCALALSTPFTLGNSLRIFGWNKFYLKNTSVIEILSKITHIVFDKTGTITRSRQSDIQFEPIDNQDVLTDTEKRMVKSLVYHSTHPVSQHIVNFYDQFTVYPVEHFEELPGQGVKGNVIGSEIKIGSSDFVGCSDCGKQHEETSITFLQINQQIRGVFRINNSYRPGLSEALLKLKSRFGISLLTGDNKAEAENLRSYFGTESRMLFNQTPFDKLNYVKQLQTENEKVLMIGDGLNDAGALKQSDAGISLSEDINTFSPASDAILDAEHLIGLSDFILFSKRSMRVIVISFIISFLYNFVGLAFAVQGTLSPLIAAVLMPISSITVILFTTGATTLLAKRMDFALSIPGLKNKKYS